MKISKSRILVFSTVATTLIYLIWRTFFTLPFGFGTGAMVFGVLLLLSEVFGMIEQIIHFSNMTVIERPKKPNVEQIEYPTVDVFIATYNEPVSLLYKTVNACTNMVYPEMDKVNIYLCDDGNREAVKELAQHFQVHYLAREDHSGAKAGNLNYAMKHSSGELIVTFDADMIPMHNFLMECVVFFMPDLENARRLKSEKGMEACKNRDGKIGFVQTPQSFYNLDLFQYNLHSEHNIPNEQDYFYKDIQLAKNRTNSVIYGGSNTVISREALEDIGGFVTNVITEDFATGMLIQAKGYQCIATDQVLASGLSPEDLESLIKQRRRWARGCIQTGRKLKVLFQDGLSLRQKMSYTASIAYWYDSIKRLIYMLAPVMYSVFGITVFVASPLELLVFWLPMYWINSVTIKWLSGNIRTLQWTNIYETIMFPLLLKDVLLEMLGVSQTKFTVTRKGDAQEDASYHFVMAIPHIILTLLTFIGTVRCTYIIFDTGNIGISFLFFWLLTNLYHLVMALFFMLGRKSFRKSERFRIEAECVMDSKYGTITGKTFDISEGGFSFWLDKPYYLEPDEMIPVTLSDLGYTVRANAKIIQVMKQEEHWKYACSIHDLEEKDYQQFLHLIHDRVPPLTKQIRENVGFFDNIRTNIVKRTSVKYQYFNRKLPRVMLEKNMVLEGENIILKSFDYWYVSLEEEKKFNPKRNRVFWLNGDIRLDLEFERVLHYGKELDYKQISLYRIENRDDIIKNELIPSVMIQLTREYEELQKQLESKSKQEVEKEFDELALL